MSNGRSPTIRRSLLRSNATVRWPARLREGFASLDAQPIPAGVEAMFARDNVVALPPRKPAPKPQR